MGALVGNGALVVDGEGGQIYVTGKPPKGKCVRKLVVPKGGRLRLESTTHSSTVREIAKEASAEHPTQNPVELARRAIENSSKTVEVVFDSFLGSDIKLTGAEVADHSDVALTKRYAHLVPGNLTQAVSVIDRPRRGESNVDVRCSGGGGKGVVYKARRK
jgi:hypothetical protein